MKFSVFQLSRQGGRATNEDRMGYAYTRDACLFVLADGMGGHPQGEVAAQIAVQTVAAQFQRQAQPRLRDCAGFLADALLQAHRQILAHARESGLADTPRTTLVAVVLQDGCARWVHCGDSRLYMVRKGTLLVRTRDHSYRELHSASGSAMPVNRNVLFSCLGSPTQPMFDVSNPMPLQRRDRILLCSDGLWDVLDEATIVRELARQRVAGAVPALVDQALLRAGSSSDNVTALALQWDSDAADVPDAALPLPGGPGEESQFNSTIQSSELDTAADEAAQALDESAIDRSIAEINATIQRSAAARNGKH